MATNRCAACKVFNVDCDNCIFAPHFPATEPMKFEHVHRIFGADKIKKFLSIQKLRSHREDVASFMVYAAEARIRDPVSGLIGLLLEHKKELETLKEKIESAKKELDNVPTYYDLPIPDIAFSTSSSLTSIIEKIEDPNEIQKKQLMQLSTADAQKIMNKIFGKREDQEMRDGHGVAGVSTFVGSSMLHHGFGARQNPTPSPSSKKA